LAVGIGLESNQVSAKHGASHLAGLINAVDNFYPSGLTSPTCMDLGFNDVFVSFERFSRFDRFACREGCFAIGYWNAVGAEKLYFGNDSKVFLTFSHLQFLPVQRNNSADYC
jgi:hypothetical protein